MYRISSDIAPYMTHPDLPQFHRQIDECMIELKQLGRRAKDLDLRLSMHPSQYIVLNSNDDRVADAAIRDVVAHAAFLDALGTGPEAKIVVHVGGVYGDRPGAIDRFVKRYATLPEAARRRLVLENDEISYSVRDTLAIHRQTGVSLIFDILHHRVNNPDGIADADACRLCLATWPIDQTPKIHCSSQRTAQRDITRRDRASGERRTVRQPAKAGQHDDWIDPDDFVAFLNATDGSHYDVMLEAKQKDRALLRLRTSLTAAGFDHRIW